MLRSFICRPRMRVNFASLSRFDHRLIRIQKEHKMSSLQDLRVFHSHLSLDKIPNEFSAGSVELHDRERSCA